MYAGVIRELGMERRGHGSALADRHGIASLGGEDFHAVSDMLNLGSADEDHLQRRVAQ